MDRRVRYTKMVLKQALLELMLKEPIAKITVTDVCSLADVNRGTFYAHYRDVYDLLEQIQNEMIDEIQKAIPTKFYRGSLRVMLSYIMNAVQDNREFCKVMFSDHGDKQFLAKLLNTAHNEALEQWRTANLDMSEAEMEQIYAFNAGGASRIIEDWVISDSSQSPEELAEFIEKISLYGIYAFSAKN